ncbi:Bacteriophage-related protein [Sphingomonas antarctica]|uniref:DUF2924 domain-containing protein n=1 Tax=Sphingomonas antarctica TaxID=2040274 RepID=UPI0039E9C8A7
MTHPVEAKIAALATMSSVQLRDEWRALTRSPVPRVSPKMLRLALAYELQAQAFGGLSRATQQKLDQLARGMTRTAVARPGTRLVREWQGRAHIVTVGEDGVIRWDERDWRSLSEVARAITGTRWSGPAFFGLKSKAVAKVPVVRRVAA